MHDSSLSRSDIQLVLGQLEGGGGVAGVCVHAIVGPLLLVDGLLAVGGEPGDELGARPRVDVELDEVEDEPLAVGEVVAHHGHLAAVVQLADHVQEVPESFPNY